MNTKSLLLIIFSTMALFIPKSKAQIANSSTPLLVRIAEIQIDSNYVDEYHAILQEEAALSMKLEPGVICIFPMYDKKDVTQIRILEIYANQEAYQNHLKTPHFLKYKNETSHMVKSLKLPDMQMIDPESLALIFEKSALAHN